MDVARLADLVWAGGALVLVVIILITRRARRHGGAFRGGVVGALYEWQTKDKQRALDVIVERKAAARRPEHPDDTVPETDGPPAAEAPRGDRKTP